MSLAKKTLNNRHAVWALAIAVAIGGVLAYVSIPLQLFPDTTPPLITVVTQNPGAPAATVARDVSDPIEEALLALEGVTVVRSTSIDNLSMLTAEFAYGRDTSLAAVDVQNAVSRIRRDLPAQIAEPQVLSFSIADRPIITLGVTMDDPTGDLTKARRLSEDVLGPRFQREKGVAAVDVFGGYESAVIVEVRPEGLEAHHLSLPQVVAAVKAAVTSLPGGRLRTERSQAMLRIETPIADIDTLKQVFVSLPTGLNLPLEDIARIHIGALDDTARFAIDGEPAIAVQVFKTVDANTVEVVAQIRSVAQELEASLPGISFLEGEETASFTETSVSNLLEGVWQALLLASILIFLFLGHPRASMVAIVSMPLSYGITFVLMYVAGVQLDMVTLSAVILAVGMVVDASVVILENVTRLRVEEKLPPLEAAIRGTDQMVSPVLAGAMTTLIVLVPLTFLPGFVGKTFGPLALTLVFAFSSSLVVALFLVPVLTLYTAGSSWFDRLGVALVWPFDWLMKRVRSGYGLVLRLALKARPLALIAAVALFGLSARAMMGQGMDVLPKMDSGAFFISLEAQSDASIDDTERLVREVEALLLKEPEVVRFQTQMGFEPGMRSSSTMATNQAHIAVTLTDRTARKDSIWEIESRIRQGLSQIPGLALAVVRETGNTARPTTAAPVVLRLVGADLLILDELADTAQDILREVPGVVSPVRSWRFDQRQPVLRVNDLLARTYGLTEPQIGQQLLAATEGIPAGELRNQEGVATDIRVRLDRESLKSRDDFLDIRLVTPLAPDGLALREVAEIEDKVGVGRVTREAGLYSLDISATVEGRALSFVIQDIESALESFEFPSGYSAGMTGENDDLKEARSTLGGTIIISIILVYLLLVSQLRSFLHPLTILLSVPLSLIGVAAGLVLAGKPVSMPVMVGLILLVGTVVNNAIILLDFIQGARTEGKPRRQAILESVEVRFRPIMMTSLSTIVGMIPLAAEWGLGTERFSPLAIAVIGGMTASTFLTLVIIPVAYDLADSVATRLFRKKEVKNVEI